MLSCKEASRKISEGMERPLSRGERIGLRLHLLLCRSCSAFRRQVRALDGLVQQRFRDQEGEPTEPLSESLPPEARERIARELDDRLG